MPVRAFTKVFLVATARSFGLITLHSGHVLHIRAMTHAAQKATNAARTVERMVGDLSETCGPRTIADHHVTIWTTTCLPLPSYVF